MVLHKAVQLLPTVTVNDSAPKYASWRLKAAEERIHSHSGGYFVDEAAMRKHEGSTLANTLRSSNAWAALSCRSQDRTGETFFVSSRSPCMIALACQRPNCFITVYVDGMLSTLRPDFDHMSTADYAIAEFYPGPSTVPPEFASTNAHCVGCCYSGRVSDDPMTRALPRAD